MYQFISVDDHLIEAPTTWTDRLPAKFRERGPRLVEVDDGECWEVEGERYFTLNNEVVAGRPPEEWGADHRPIRRSEMLPEYYDPVVRARELRPDGFIGSVCFATLPRFSGTLFLRLNDKELADLSVRAYNDWMIDEWCASVPGFYIPMIITQVWDPVAGAAEVRRCAEKGNRAVSLIENPVPLGLPSYQTTHWDPLWQAIEETGTTVCMHIGTSGSLPVPSPDGPFTTTIVLAQTNAQACLANLLFSPVLTKFPELKVVLCEGGIGWLPALLERADRMWETHRVWDNLADVRPSDLFRRNIWGCFIGDRIGVLLRHEIGLDRIMWENDYPHAESPWPHSQKLLDEVLHDVPRAETDLMTHGNAMKVFNWNAS